MDTAAGEAFDESLDLVGSPKTFDLPSSFTLSSFRPHALKELYIGGALKNLTSDFTSGIFSGALGLLSWPPLSV